MMQMQEIYLAWVLVWGSGFSLGWYFRGRVLKSAKKAMSLREAQGLKNDELSTFAEKMTAASKKYWGE